jgi:hypothetical protein
MRRFLTIFVFYLLGVAVAPAAEATPVHWHGIWMNGLNVLWIVAGPTEAFAVAAAAYHRLGPKSYLDAQVEFDAIPAGNKLLLALGSRAGCTIELSYIDQHIVARDNGKCAGERVTFNGTYTRQ